MPESKTLTSSFLDQDDWKEILDSLDDGKCILCIGPGLFSKPDEPRLEKQLADYLKAGESDLGIRVYEDGWFHYLPGATEIKAYKKVKEFYNRPNERTDAILRKIAAIPFHFILNFTPDYKLKEAFDDMHFPSVFKSYIKKEAFEKDIEIPTKEKPLIFNILGEIEKRNSLIMGYNDFYLYLESIFERSSMSPKLLENIFDADYFLFLGLSFDKWYVHLFMRMLKQHSEKRGSEKFAIGLSVRDDQISIQCSEQYSITSIPNFIEDFVNEFYEYCAQKDLLRKPNEEAMTQKTIELPFEALENLFVKNKFEKIFEVILDNLKMVETDDKQLINLSINLQSQYNSIKQKQMMSLLREEEFTVLEGNIRKNIQDLIGDLKKTFPNQDQK